MNGCYDLLIRASNGLIACRTYFFFMCEFYTFLGSRYYKFDHASNRVTSQGAIESLFKSNGQWAFPKTDLDAGFYEYNTRTIFFFKGTKVK